MLTLHCAVLAGAVTGHYRYGDRSEHFEKSMKGLGDTLAALKRHIASGLAERLRPVFENAQSVTGILLDASGKQFEESFVNPVGSEAYRESIFSFATGEAESILGLRALLDGRDRWLYWARIQSWTFLFAVFVEGGMAATLFLFENLLGKSVDLRIGLATLIPTTVFFITFMVAACRLSVLHDVFVELRKKYASP